MNLKEILVMRGLDVNSKIKLIRHQDNEYDIEKLYSLGMLDTYQRIQSKDVFKECNFVVSFIGIENSNAKLIGVYKVADIKKVSEVDLPSNFIYKDMYRDDYFCYQLEKVEGFEDIIDRLIIKWGNGTRSWHQWLRDKEVVSILPKGYFKAFPGYLNFVLTFDELHRIINNQEANIEWHTMLKVVSGIYLILDTTSGLQYVGSAYGAEGILGRWKNYSLTKHGGNKLLINLLEAHPNQYKNFRFTILHTISQAMTGKEIVEYEKRYKEKLGTRAFGLNQN